MPPPTSNDTLVRVLETMPVAVALVTIDQYTFVNDAFCRTVGSSRDALLGKHPFSIIAPEDKERLVKTHQARMRGEPLPLQYETTCIGEDGRARRCEVEFQPLPSGSDAVIFVRALDARVRDRDLLTALGALQAKVHRERSVAGVLDVAVRGLRELGFNACVGQHLGDECALVVHAFQPLVEPLLRLMFHEPAGGLAIPLKKMPVTHAALREGRSYFRHDATDSLVRLALHAGVERARIEDARRNVPELNAAISPLMVHGQPWGVLMALAEDLRANDAAALALFTSQVASSVEVAQNIEDLEAIHQVALFGAEETPEALLGRLLPLLAKATHSDAASIFHFDETRGTLELVGTTLPKEIADNFRSIPAIFSATGSVVLPRARITIDDIPEPMRTHTRPTGFAQMAVVPLKVNGRVSGLMTMGRKSPLPYTETALHSAEILGAQAALQLERVRLYAEARRRVDQLMLMNELGAMISRHLELNEVFAIAVQHVSQIAGVPNTFLLLLDEAQQHLQFAATNVKQQWIVGSKRPLTERSAASAAVRTLQPVVIRDAEADERINQELAGHFGHRALMAIPIVSHEKAIGALVLGETRSTREFSQEEVNRSLAIANQLGTAIVNARLFEDLKRSYDELNRTQQELVKRERLAALGELSALVAHEVRNPLGVIFNSTASIRKLPPGSEAASQLLSLVEEEAERLNRMVSDLLDFAGPSPARVRPERLELILSGALEAASRAQPNPNVRLELAVSAQLPEVPVDAQKLRQAIVNLVVNAIQAMPAGGGSVRVRAEPAELRGRPAAKLCIEDDGPGMPEDIAARAFEPFFTTRAAGTGLGLSVVKRIADAHGADVTIQSSPGKGSTFTMTLPLAE